MAETENKKSGSDSSSGSSSSSSGSSSSSSSSSDSDSASSRNVRSLLYIFLYSILTHQNSYHFRNILKSESSSSSDSESESKPIQMNGKKTKSLKNEKPKKSRKIEPEPAKPTIFIPSGLKWAQSDHVTEIVGMFYRLCDYRHQSLRG